MTPLASRLRSAWAILAALALFILAGCILGLGDTAKRGSEVENEVYGVLVAVDGNPVQGAKVKAVPVSKVAKVSAGAAAADSDSVVTDGDGRYSFRGLQAGVYNLFGEEGSGTDKRVVLIPDVDRTDTTRRFFVGKDTLRAPGRIQGRLIQDVPLKGLAVAFVPGTSFLATVDDSGRFALSGLPQGRYAVRYSVPGFLVEPDTGVMVRSDETTQLADKRLKTDPEGPPPEPEAVKAVLDTSRLHVRLSWSPVRVEDLQGYLVYRDEPGKFEPVAIGLASDTAFTDSTFPFPDSARVLVYRVRSRDREATLSTKYSPADSVAIPAGVGGVQTFWHAPLEDTVVAGDSVNLVLGFASVRKPLLRIEWRQADGDSLLRSCSSPPQAGRDTLAWAGKEGRAAILVHLVDGTGRTTVAVRNLVVLPAPPLAKVDAGRDRSVKIGAPVTLSGRVPDSFGAVVNWEWRIGSSAKYTATAYGDTSFLAPPGVDSVECVLRVSNGRGQSDSDRVVVRIIRPKELEWNESPLVAPFPGIMDARFVPFKGKLYMIGGAIGHVINEDDMRWLPSKDFWTTTDGVQWTRIEPKGFPPRAPAHALVHRDKLWIFGGVVEAGGEAFDDVWNSEDGEHFTKVTDSAGLRDVAAIYTHGLRMVAISRGPPDSEGLATIWYPKVSSNGISWPTQEMPLPFIPFGGAAVAGDRAYLTGKYLDGGPGIWSSENIFGWQEYPLGPLANSSTFPFLAQADNSVRVVAMMFERHLQYHALGAWSISGAGVPTFLSDASPAWRTGHAWAAAYIGGKLLVFNSEFHRNPERYETRIWSTK